MIKTILPHLLWILFYRMVRVITKMLQTKFEDIPCWNLWNITVLILLTCLFIVTLTFDLSRSDCQNWLQIGLCYEFWCNNIFLTRFLIFLIFLKSCDIKTRCRRQNHDDASDWYLNKDSNALKLNVLWCFAPELLTKMCFLNFCQFHLDPDLDHNQKTRVSCLYMWKLAQQFWEK